MEIQINSINKWQRVKVVLMRGFRFLTKLLTALDFDLIDRNLKDRVELSHELPVTLRQSISTLIVNLNWSL